MHREEAVGEVRALHVAEGGGRPGFCTVIRSKHGMP
ncbi:hypothetical protein N566_10860 [Streptomycetaceae bacterium MP113-05]|nr:hypothetical protein N566_10860 [Streptomycetaceae bacterium MP113-05]